MAKHNPAGEVCPLCPAGTPVGFCVRHLAGWDPEKTEPEREACDLDPKAAAAAKPENVATFDRLRAFLARLPLQPLGGLRFHLGVCGGQTAEDVRILQYDDRNVLVLLPGTRIGGNQAMLFWGDIIELWRL